MFSQQPDYYSAPQTETGHGLVGGGDPALRAQAIHILNRLKGWKGFESGPLSSQATTTTARHYLFTFLNKAQSSLEVVIKGISV